jgi:TRAP-type C4-dicarboxylate transport system substrate-binding protein|tara:strand:+ start:2537 stop:3535 length:999 start_codon:yes stop_codon:yes gene_type:complete
MNIFKRIPFVFSLCLLSAISSSVLADTVRLKLAGTLPAKHFGNEIIEDMVKEIEAANVDLKVKFFPASQLGSGEELIEDAVRGNIDIVQAFVYAQADPRLEITNLPGLVTSFEDLIATFGNPDSNYNKLMTEILNDLGLVYISSAGEGLVGIVAEKKPLDHAGFGEKGLNIRVWSSDLAKQTVESIGYRTTTMNWAEVLPALQSGVIDGAICCTPEWAYNTFAIAGVGKYYVPVNANVEATAFYGSQKTWDKLNKEQKDVLEAAIRKASKAIMNKAWERSNGFVDKMKESGWEILDYTDSERAAMIAHIKATVWPSVASTIGQETLDKLTAK